MNLRGYLLLMLIFIFAGCGGADSDSSGTSISIMSSKGGKDKSASSGSTLIVDTESKGVGPVKSLMLPNVIDQQLVGRGEKVFKRMCTACHMVGRKFIASAPNGLLERRSPEWIMNMILNPEVMIKEDPLAKELQNQSNASPMINQNLSMDEARAVLEYFRTLR